MLTKRHDQFICVAQGSETKGCMLVDEDDAKKCSACEEGHYMKYGQCYSTGYIAKLVTSVIEGVGVKGVFLLFGLIVI